jgi:hypothetical protein
MPPSLDNHIINGEWMTDKHGNNLHTFLASLFREMI